MTPHVILRKVGDGTETGPEVYHAVPTSGSRAFCGTEPGENSAWFRYPGNAVTCRRCAKRLAKLDERPKGREIQMKYTKSLKKVMDEEPAASGYSRDELNRRIETIGQKLKEPMPNVERILLCGDRAAYRKALAALNGRVE